MTFQLVINSYGWEFFSYCEVLGLHIDVIIYLRISVRRLGVLGGKVDLDLRLECEDESLVTPDVLPVAVEVENPVAENTENGILRLDEQNHLVPLKGVAFLVDRLQ